MACTAWLILPRPQLNPRLRLFCLPFAGGGAALFRAWPEALSASVEVCAVELPGRGSRLREPAYTDLERLLDSLTGAILPLLDRPFALFGHSMGALIGFELARRLRRKVGLLPEHLFVGAHRAPQVSASNAPIHRLPDSTFVAKLRALNGSPTKVLDDPDLMRLFMPTLRADFAVCETYCYTVADPLDCPISVFGGLADREVSREELEPWRVHTSSDFSVQMLPGDHYFVRSASALLLQAIGQDLSR